MHAEWVLLRNAGFQEALAEDPIGEAASWSELNTWTAQDQAEVDALLPKGDFSCKACMRQQAQSLHKLLLNSYM